ncbi:MAG: alginate lyase family protein [Cyclobacteriaceae bacterium]|nr:alginate lyase family protein [Cyclobacteriaceae bacterium SS2]
MRIPFFKLIPLLLLLLFACGQHNQQPENPQLLWSSKPLIISDDLKASIISSADEMMDEGPYSVLQKTFTPPSGNKHDYMSMGIYWWPNPETQDGLPYIRKDGLVNPEVHGITDKKYLSETQEIALVCGLAYHLTKDEKYAAKSAEVLRHWFINDSTRMNPNLNFGQGVPGRADGRCYGIIETRDISQVMDAEMLIRNSNAWGAEDQQQLKNWMFNYMNWLLTSELGKEEFTRYNNHGTWYDVQVSSIAIAIGDSTTAKRILAGSADRILAHVDSEGKQPEELARTRTWDYSTMNLNSLMLLGILGQKVGLDLWSIPNDDDPAIRRALDFLLPFALAPDAWEYEQVLDFKPERIVPLLEEAIYHYPERREVYQNALSKLTDINHIGFYRLP